MFIAVNQMISEDSMKERAPEGYFYDDPWEVAREVAECLRGQYHAWLEQRYPGAMIEVDKVKEGNGPQSTEVEVVVFCFGRMDEDIKQTIQTFLNRVRGEFDMLTIDRNHLLAIAS